MALNSTQNKMLQDKEIADISDQLVATVLRQVLQEQADKFTAKPATESAASAPSSKLEQEAELAALAKLVSEQARDVEALVHPPVDIHLPSDFVEKEKEMKPVLEKVPEEPEETEEPEKPAVEKPQFNAVARSEKDGTAKPISSIVQGVGRTNPLHDEILFTIASLKADDAALTTVEIKDYALSTALANGIAEALASNTNLKSLTLTNVGLQNASGVLLAKSLARHPGVEYLNLESNALGPQAMKELARMLETNSSISEMRLANQKSITAMGMDAEEVFANALSGKNTTLCKLGLSFRSKACRDRVERGVARNKEAALSKLLHRTRAVLQSRRGSSLGYYDLLLQHAQWKAETGTETAGPGAAGATEPVVRSKVPAEWELDSSLLVRHGQHPAEAIDPVWLKTQSAASLSRQLASLSKPMAPSAEACCMSGCAVCVWDVYSDEFDKYKAEKSKLTRAKALLLGLDSVQDAAAESDSEVMEEMDPSIKAFREMELALKTPKD
ncbi:Tropomodulin-2 [Kappamyces sp. JEL0680]|nr:Tropomodulin-2 [Kappamyces sp. JEL0680]